MSVQRVHLTPDRSLLDPTFESYKLSLDSLPTFQTGLSQGGSTRIRSCSEDQYSYLHAKLFGQTNLLAQDPFNNNSVFLLDAAAGQICRILFDPEGVSAPPEVVSVWTFPSGLARPTNGDYNVSLAFANETLAVIGDGTGVIFILETGDRSSGSPRQWKVLFHDEICGKNRPFTVVSAALIETTGDATRVLHVLLNYVQEKTQVDGLKQDKIPNHVSFVNVVEWMTFASGGEHCWGLDRARRFAFFGGIDYLQLDKSAAHLICATDKQFNLVFDSIGTMEIDEEDKVTQRDPEKPPPPFYWYQGVDDIVVWLALPPGTGKRDINVTLKPREMVVTLRTKDEIIIVGGELWNVLDSESMTWTIQKGNGGQNKLEINVCKANGGGLIWQRFVKDQSKDGEEISNSAAIDELLAQQQQQESSDEPLPAYNAQELEDCDALPDDSFALFVVDGSSSKTSLQIPLSGHQLLFNVTASVPSALGLRHDVDALVWQPTSRADGSVTFSHIGTFSALGYVQASKAQRKFTLAAPNLSYAVIVETSRRAYVYRQPSAIPSEFDVRNRKSGQRLQQVAKQQVITLEGNDDILGVAATDKTLILMTATKIFCHKIA